MKNICLFAAFFLQLAFASPSFSQDTNNRLIAATKLASDLQFPEKVSAFSFFSTPEMALYKPEGDGPFPALVLMHQCGGLGSGTRNNQSMLQWAKTAVSRGYVALVIDSLGPRGVSSVCMGVQGGVNFPRGTRDALQAGDHLRKMAFVDKERIALAGFSWGGMNAALASSQAWGKGLAEKGRFTAAVAFYPGCFAIRPASGSSYEIIHPDIDRPLLVLMGDKDNETPPEECTSRLQLAKQAGAPVEWHVYPGATHCWDCKHLNNFSKVDFRGAQVRYLYDENVTKDSEQRMFEFLERSMPLKQPKPPAS